MSKNMPEIAGKLWAVVKKNKFIVIVLLIGLVLILLPTGSRGDKSEAQPAETQPVSFLLSEQEARIAAALSKIEGAGQVEVVLTLKTGTEQILATDKSSSGTTRGEGASAENSTETKSTTVVVSSGGSVESPVTLKTVYPEYLGALVVCEGADNPTVAYQIVKAVAGLTGLGTDKIVVSKMNES
jgi:stage III sporulation protein AG